MSKGFKKTPVKATESEDQQLSTEEIRQTFGDIEADGPPDDLIGSFSSALPVGQGPDEDEQERLRVQLRDIANPPREETDTGEAAAFQSLNVATGSPGLHHGYPPHSPGEGIQGGLQPLPDYQRLNGLKPSIGRIVLFASPQYPDPQAAIITGVYNATEVDLHVFRRLDVTVPAAKVPEGAPGDRTRRWFWPPRG